MTLKLTTLGRLDLRSADGTEIRPLLAQPKRLAVFIYLALLPAGSYARRDTLLGLFWPEMDQDHARAALRKALHFIRAAAGGDLLESRGADEIGIRPGAVVADLTQVRNLVADGDTEGAFAAYGGPFLHGFHLRSSAFDGWVAGERDRLRRLLSDAAWRQCLADIDGGAIAAAREWGERAIATAPDNEAAFRQVVRRLDAAGDPISALALYQLFASRLAAEYATTPSPETRALVAALREPAAPPEPTATDSVAAAPGVQNAAAAPAGPSAAAPEAPTPPRVPGIARRDSIRTALLATVALALAVAAWGTRERASLASPPETLAVGAFDVPADSTLASMGQAVRAALRARLSIAIPGGAPESAWRQPPPTWRLEGAVLPATEGIAITASLTAVGSGGPVIRAHVAGPPRELHRLQEQLGTELLAGWALHSGNPLAEAAIRSARSPLALAEWFEGETHRRAGRYLRAAEAHRRALATDSGYAVAAFGLADALYRSGSDSAARLALGAGWATRPATPTHVRSLISAFAATLNGDHGEAQRRYRRLLAEAPRLADGWLGLAHASGLAVDAGGGSRAAERSAIGAAVNLEPRDVATLMSAARLALAADSLEQVDSLSRRALERAPDEAVRTELLVIRAVAVADADARDRLVARPLDAPAIASLWRVSAHCAPGRLLPLVRSLIPVAADSGVRASLLLLAAHLEMGRGDRSSSESALAALARLAPRIAAQTRALFALLPGGGARQAVPPLQVRGSGLRVHAGGWVTDSLAPHAAAVGRALDLARGVRVAGGGSSFTDLYLLAAGADRSGAAAALSAVGAIRAPGSAAIPDSPLFPRAFLHLEVARLLEATGDLAGARARLEAVPDGAGFGAVAARVARQRTASLLDRMGRPDAAARERARGRDATLGTGHAYYE